MAAKKKTAAKRKSGLKGKVADLPKQTKRLRKGAAGIGHNGAPAGISDDEIKAMQDKLDRQFTKFQKAQADAKTENSTYRDMLKDFGKKGLDKQAYIEARNLDKEDHGIVQVRYANIGRYLQVRGSNLATQMELFQDIEAPAVPDEAPAVKGLKAGRGGFDRTENPFAPGSPDYQAYDDAWLTGQKEISEKMRPGSATVN